MNIKDMFEETLRVVNNHHEAIKREITYRAPIVTSFSFFRVDDKPGLLTPWWEKTSDGENMGLSAAGLELMVRAGSNFYYAIHALLDLPGNVLDSVLYQETIEEQVIVTTKHLSLTFIYSIDLVVEFVLNALAILTRTLASVVLGVGSFFSNESGTESDRSRSLSQDQYAAHRRQPLYQDEDSVGFGEDEQLYPVQGVRANPMG